MTPTFVEQTEQLTGLNNSSPAGLASYSLDSLLRLPFLGFGVICCTWPLSILQFTTKIALYCVKYFSCLQDSNQALLWSIQTWIFPIRKWYHRERSKLKKIKDNSIFNFCEVKGKQSQFKIGQRNITKMDAESAKDARDILLTKGSLRPIQSYIRVADKQMYTQLYYQNKKVNYKKFPS